MLYSQMIGGVPVNVEKCSGQVPLVTCIVICYKKFEYLFGAIRSVLTQNYPRIELLVSDDASPNFETYREQITQFVQQNARNNLEYYYLNHHEENQGIVRNINSMLRRAKGDYFFTLAGDDEFYDDTVFQRIVDRFLETGTDFLSCSRLWCDQNLTPQHIVPSPENLEKIRRLDTPEKQFRSFAVFNFFDIASGSAMYYNRAHLERLGYLDERYRQWEDGPRLAAYTKAGNLLTPAHDIVSIRYRDGGISNIAPASSKEKVILGQDHLNYIANVLIPNRRGTNLRRRRFWMFWYGWDTSTSNAERRRLLLRYPEYLVKFLWRKLRGKPIR